jgi:hypothetical protein
MTQARFLKIVLASMIFALAPVIIVLMWQYGGDYPRIWRVAIVFPSSVGLAFSFIHLVDQYQSVRPAAPKLAANPVHDKRDKGFVG